MWDFKTHLPSTHYTGKRRRENLKLQEGGDDILIVQKCMAYEEHTKNHTGPTDRWAAKEYQPGLSKRRRRKKKRVST